MLSKEQLAVLATELAKQQYANLLADQDYEAIAALLNDRPMVDNPVAQVAGDSIAMTLGLPRVEPRDVQAVQNV